MMWIVAGNLLVKKVPSVQRYDDNLWDQTLALTDESVRNNCMHVYNNAYAMHC